MAPDGRHSKRGMVDADADAGKEGASYRFRRAPHTMMMVIVLITAMATFVVLGADDDYGGVVDAGR